MKKGCRACLLPPNCTWRQTLQNTKLNYFGKNTKNHLDMKNTSEEEINLSAETFIHMPESVGLGDTKLLCISGRNEEYEMSASGVEFARVDIDKEVSKEMTEDGEEVEMEYSMIWLSFRPDFDDVGGHVTLSKDGIDATLTWLVTEEGHVEMQDFDGNKVVCSKTGYISEHPTEEVLEAEKKAELLLKEAEETHDYVEEYLNSHVEEMVCLMNTDPEDEKASAEALDDFINKMMEGTEYSYRLLGMTLISKLSELYEMGDEEGATEH